MTDSFYSLEAVNVIVFPFLMYDNSQLAEIISNAWVKLFVGINPLK